jgi:hypothetical protein
MEMMDLPETALLKKAKKKEFTSEDFYRAAGDLIREGKKMKAVDHPDSKFNQFSAIMINELELFEDSIKSKKAEEISKSWSAVVESCVKCHDQYD